MCEHFEIFLPQKGKYGCKFSVPSIAICKKNCHLTNRGALGNALPPNVSPLNKTLAIFFCRSERCRCSPAQIRGALAPIMWICIYLLVFCCPRGGIWLPAPGTSQSDYQQIFLADQLGTTQGPDPKVVIFHEWHVIFLWNDCFAAGFFEICTVRYPASNNDNASTLPDTLYANVFGLKYEHFDTRKWSENVFPPHLRMIVCENVRFFV